MIKRIAKKLAKKTSPEKIKTTSTKKRKTKRKISQEEFYSLIGQKAYEFFEKRGYQHGDDQRDWYEAEKAVKSEYKI